MFAKKNIVLFLIIFASLLSPFSIEIPFSIAEPVISITTNSADALQLAECGLLGFGCDVVNGILTFYEFIWFDLSQVFLVLVGLIMDIIIGFSISSNFYRGSGIIEAGWEILRDLTNILFIFSLLIIAFKMVLGQNDSRNKERLLKTILIALVVNFSLFGSYLIIDASNILANTFYNRIEADSSNYVANINTDGIQQGEERSAGLIDVVASFKELGVDKSVSLAVAGTINPQRIITAGGVNNFFQALIIVTSMGIMNIFLMWVFGSIILTFLGRILGLIILVILSPIALLSIVIPGMRSQKYIGWDNWFPEILKLSFMAPIFLFFLWLTVKFTTNEGVLATLSRANPDASIFLKIINTYLLLFLIGGILYTAKKITQSLAGDLGNLASKTIQGAVGGTIAAAGIAATGGATLAGAGARGLGQFASATGSEKTGAWLKNKGKAAMSFKADVTKIPGFRALAGGTVTDMLSKVTGKTSRGAEVAARSSMNEIRTGLDNIIQGRSKTAEEYQKQLQDSRNNLDQNRIENRQINAVKDAKDTIKVAQFTDGKDGKKIFDRWDEQSVDLEKALQEKQGALARRTSIEAKIEKDAIEDKTRAMNIEIKSLEAEARRLSNTGDSDDKLSANALREDVELKKKEIKDVEKSSLTGQITQIEKKIDDTKNTARAEMLQNDRDNRTVTQNSSVTIPESARQERVDTQAAQVGAGNVKTSPNVGGDPKAQE